MSIIKILYCFRSIFVLSLIKLKKKGFPMTDSYSSKLFVTLKYYLLGKKYYIALKALEYARKHHDGLRKDGITPEFQHMLEIALYLKDLSSSMDNEELVLAAALLHDTVEDCDISIYELEEKFGKKVSHSVWLLTKKTKNITKKYDSYFSDIANDPIASLVKGADRINNVQSMNRKHVETNKTVFSLEKQKQYVQEVKTYFLPMLKKAKQEFPQQTHSYFNIIFVLKSQVELIELLIENKP